MTRETIEVEKFLQFVCWLFVIILSKKKIASVLFYNFTSPHTVYNT